MSHRRHQSITTQQVSRHIWSICYRKYHVYIIIAYITMVKQLIVTLITIYQYYYIKYKNLHYI